ncbi:MAG: DUF5681 domain-containing protein [Sedimenticola sp.]
MGNEKTRFKPGQSGNPKGKPKGSGKGPQLRAMLQPHASELVEKVVSMALEGDTTALKMCIDRLIPPIRSRDSSIVLDDLKADAKLTEQGEKIIVAMASGKISPMEASTMMKTVSDQARVVEVEELEKRITALEEK